jgi:adenosylhomocysteine nucleosidase
MATADLLFVASVPREFDGLAARCEAVRPLLWPVLWSRAGALCGRSVLLVANGVGGVRAAEAVRVAAGRRPIAAVISAGYCGALEKRLAIGDIFVATCIESAGRRIPVNVPEAAARFTAGPIMSVDRVASSAAVKAALRERGAYAVEMEAAGIADEAAQIGAPVFCIRSVTDLADESFVVDFDAALREDGQFSTGRILWQAFRKPAAFPELIRLRRRCQTASGALGEFLAGCRF